MYSSKIKNAVAKANKFMAINSQYEAINKAHNGLKINCMLIMIGCY